MKNPSRKIAKKVPFSKLSKPQKRVAIAKDVLQQIKQKKYIAEAERYVSRINFVDAFDSYGEDIKSNFKKIKDCRVCAMGACLMSATKFANKLNFEDVGHSISDLKNEKVQTLFAEIFSPKQLLLIETAFEGNNGGDKVGEEIFEIDSCQYANEKIKCDKFHDKYDNPQSRMIGIMENIIKNKGEFKP